jgi:hypothetical protein
MGEKYVTQMHINLKKKDIRNPTEIAKFCRETKEYTSSFSYQRNINRILQSEFRGKFSILNPLNALDDKKNLVFLIEFGYKRIFGDKGVNSNSVKL